MANIDQLTEESMNNAILTSGSDARVLSNEELKAIAKKLNEWINLPIVSEEIEGIVLFKLARQIDLFLQKTLPNEIYAFVQLAEQGIADKSKIEILKVRLAKLINQHVNIPWCDELTEQKIFEAILDFICDALKAGVSILTPRLV